jgi:hypothetical protein
MNAQPIRDEAVIASVEGRQSFTHVDASDRQ